MYAGFTDLSKAFDTIWRIGLLAKILRYEICGKLDSIIKNMYNQVKCCVKNNSSFSQFFQTNLGVEQGEVLCPILSKFIYKRYSRYIW